jgi:hypothetical protein
MAANSFVTPRPRAGEQEKRGATQFIADGLILIGGFSELGGMKFKAQSSKLERSSKLHRPHRLGCFPKRATVSASTPGHWSLVLGISFEL